MGKKFCMENKKKFKLDFIILNDKSSVFMLLV